MQTIADQIYEEHARQAAFLWLLRDRAVVDPAYGLASLADLDDRLEAHLDGLRLGGDGGFAACRDLLADPEGGEVFGAAVVAIDRWDLRGLASVLDVGGEAPDLARGLASALGWTSFAKVEQLLPGLLSSEVPPALHWLGIVACAAHRRDPGTALGYAVLSKDQAVRIRALRAVGELGRMDLLSEVREALTAEDEPTRFWAAWSAALCGEETPERVLWEIAGRDGPFATRAAATAMRRLPPRAGVEWVRALAGRPGRAAFHAAAALGDPALVPWLIEATSTPLTARLAGFAVTMITGVDLGLEKLASKAPVGAGSGAAPEGDAAGPTDDPEDEDVSEDPDDGLPWPDRERVERWWQGRAGDFQRGVRHLLGKPIAPDWLEVVLRRGSQPARAAAAAELCVRRARRGLFEVRAPAPQQRSLLTGRG
jgi:uncharacterized protein (TIGR02270 family)